MESKSHPKIGLALGSGSARGWAHIGVIRELQSMGLTIHAIAGCSIGSLVGAAFALGRLDELEAWAKSLTLRHTAMLLIDPHWGAGGLLRGDRVFKLLKSLHFDNLIEQSEFPFAAVATDMHSGEEIWLKTGSFLDAIRGSAAIPGLVKPHYLDQRWLLDGGLVNPVPVALARSLGCDKVIAVNLNHNLMNPKPAKAKKSSDFFTTSKRWLAHPIAEMAHWISNHWPYHHVSPAANLEPTTTPPQADSLLDLTSEILSKDLASMNPNYRQVILSMMTIMQDRITRYRLKLDSPEIELSPDLSHLSFLEFHTAEESIEEGRRVVREQADQIFKLLELTRQERLQEGIHLTPGA